MSKKFYHRFNTGIILLMLLESCFADPDKEGREFAEMLHQKPLLDQQKALDELRQQSHHGLESQVSGLESLFDAEGDVGKKGEDPLKSSLGKKNLELTQQKNPYQPSLSEAENLLKQKHRFKISHTDPIFKTHQEISKVGLGDKEGLFQKSQPPVTPLLAPKDGVVTCRQSIKPELKNCIKRLVLQVIPQPPISKMVTTYVTFDRWVENPCGCESCSRGGGGYFRRELIPQQTQVSVPQTPLLKERWEGCEDLERRTQEGSCERIESEEQNQNETRSIPEYPSPLTRPHWSERHTFICGVGKEIDECETLIKQGCEQIDSKCAVLKMGFVLNLRTPSDVEQLIT